MLVREWEDRLQCAEALNVAFDSLSPGRQDEVAFVALVQERDNAHYTAVVFDRRGFPLSEAPVLAACSPTAPSLSVFALDPDHPSYDAVSAYAEHGHVLDADRVRSYDWDAAQR